MEVLYFILLLFGWLVLLGYIRPWWVLWWNEAPNRIKVLKYYGIPLLLMAAIIVIAQWFF